MSAISGLSRRHFIGSVAGGVAATFVGRAAAPTPFFKRPPALRPGDVIALISPGFAISVQHPPGLLDVAIAALRRNGFRVKVMPHCRGRSPDGKGGSVAERVADLNQALSDPEVRMVLGTVGGGGTFDVVTSGRVDWKALERDPKLICGYSDLNYLTAAAHWKTGLVTLDGPLAIFHWGCLPKPPEYTTRSFLAVAGGTRPVGALPAAGRISYNPFPFSGEQDMARRLVPAGPWQCIRPGLAQGRLLIIRPDQLLDLVRTGYDFSFRKRLWCFDPIWAYEKSRRELAQVLDRGLVGDAAGIVVARRMANQGKPPMNDAAWADFLRRTVGALGIPVLADVDCGHTIPRLTLPNGVWATLDASRLLLRIDEPAVS